FYHLSYLLKDRGDFSGALQAIQKGIEMDPLSPFFFDRLYKLSARLGEWEKARLALFQNLNQPKIPYIYFTELITIAPERCLLPTLDRYESRSSFADVYISLGFFPEGEGILKTMPQSPDTLLVLATLYFYGGRHREALSISKDLPSTLSLDGAPLDLGI